MLFSELVEESFTTHELFFEAGVGILVTTGSTGYLISGNSIFDCPTTIQDPKVRNIAQLLKPQR